MRRHILLFIAFCLNASARGQSIEVLDPLRLPQPTQAKALRYWFDDDLNINICDVNEKTQVLDVSTLFDGLHTLHYQVVDTEGKVSYLASDIFLKIKAMQGNSNVTAEQLIYWFDDENEIVSVDMRTGVITLDASYLTDGLHTVHYLVACSDGSVTSAYSSIFMRMNIDIISTTARSLRYWFDNETDVISTEIAQGTQILDISHLLDGLHTVHYQVVDDLGSVTSTASGMFLKVTEIDKKVTTAQSLRYWFDDETDVKTTNMANGIHTLDVSDLLTGLHTLHYQIVDSNGQLTSTYSGIFMKMLDKPVEDGQNRITKYQYWLNDNSEGMHTVTLNDATNPYTLITLLPMQKEPFRSSNFLFEIKEGLPMAYAKNEFYIRFHDAANYWVDESRHFIDYSIKQEVIPEQVLEGFTCNVPMQKPGFNEIHWYTFEAAPGDTTAFKLSQPATIQVFAPNGEEVFKTSEYESTNWDGIHTWEEGTYYIAVHDVTGSQSTMSLDYMHMDKYDVIDWDVHKVGNAGCSTITFKGNGFRDLYAVDLVIDPGDTIRSIDVGHESDAETSVTFDFTDERLGKYNAVFHFTEEDKYIANVVSVEKAVDIELATEVTFPSTFMSGSSTTYTINITNKGNMTAYAVPISMHISSNTTEGISYLKINGLVLNSLYEYIADKDEMSISELNKLKELSDEIGDDHYFVKVRNFDENINDSITIRSACFFVNLSPSSTTTITIIIDATETVELWAGIPNQYDNALIASNGSRRKGPVESFCCYHEKIECIADAASAAANITALLLATMAPETAGTSGVGAVISEIAGCVSSVISSASSFSATLACDRDKGPKDKFFSFKGLANGISAIGALLSCDALKKLELAAQVVVTMGRGVTVPASIMNCSTALKKKPNCPPDSPHGGTSTPFNSHDPNAIIGYVAESGSMAIKEDLTDVFYTIQFENDTVFATAPAHDIYLTDTLDVNLFNLSTYRPTRITIGEKSMKLTGERNFISTLDMRPEINAIAQIHGTIDDNTGVVRWHISSLDPMTMERTTDPMVGVLPVNYDGSGLGEASYNISLKPGLPDGTIIPNRSGNIFDNNETVLTPTWTNIVDAVAPSSAIEDFEIVNDTILRINVEGIDNRSGIWKYVLYAQYGEYAPWWKISESDSTSFDFRFYDDIDYGFCVLATDSAGNVEKKVIQRERSLKVHDGVYEDTFIEVPTKTISPDDEFDISGRKVSRKAKGIIIRNRKKTLVTE